MDTCITYDSIKLLLANPPSIEPRPNFFNLQTLRTHFACPQSSVNGWAGAVMSPEMYALIDNTPFCLRIATETTTTDYLDKLDAQCWGLYNCLDRYSRYLRTFEWYVRIFKYARKIAPSCRDLDLV
jgi:hypothetical protein